MRTPRIILRSIPIPFLQIVFRQAVNEVSSLKLKVEEKQREESENETSYKLLPTTISHNEYFFGAKAV